MSLRLFLICSTVQLGYNLCVKNIDVQRSKRWLSKDTNLGPTTLTTYLKVAAECLTPRQYQTTLPTGLVPLAILGHYIHIKYMVP